MPQIGNLCKYFAIIVNSVLFVIFINNIFDGLLEDWSEDIDWVLGGDLFDFEIAILPEGMDLVRCQHDRDDKY